MGYRTGKMTCGWTETKGYGQCLFYRSRDVSIFICSGEGTAQRESKDSPRAKTQIDRRSEILTSKIGGKETL